MSLSIRRVVAAARRIISRTRSDRSSRFVDYQLPAPLQAALSALPLLEVLEHRKHLDSAAIVGSKLAITGNASTSNVIDVEYNESTNKIKAVYNGQTAYFNRGSLTGITIDGGSASDTISIDETVHLRTTMHSGAGDDSIFSSTWNDLIYAGAGDDTVFSQNGYDVIYGEDGDDVVDAGASTDTVFGGSGSDIAVNAERGSSNESSTLPNTNQPTGIPTGAVSLDSAKVLRIIGQSSIANTIKVTLTANQMQVSYNNAITSFNATAVEFIEIEGGSQADTLTIAANIERRSTMLGGSGNDTISGGAWTDRIEGENGDDSIIANAGSDFIIGGDGNDSIDAGSSSDTIYGNAGNDSANGALGEDWSYDVESRVSIEHAAGNLSPIDIPTVDPSAVGLPPIIGQGQAPVARITTPAGTNVMAGMTIHVDALTSTLNAGNPTTARYEWDFGEPGSPYNKLVGFNAAHNYKNPGSYTVTLRVFNENGRSSITTKSITVTPDTRTIYYVASNGNDSNAGTLNRPFKTWNKVVEVTDRLDNVKILFRRGDTFTVGDNAFVIYGENVVVGAYGTGEKPVLKWNGTRDRRRYIFVPDMTSKNITIRDFTMTSVYDAPDGDQTNMVISVMPYAANVSVIGCTFLDVGYAVNSSAQPTGLLVQDNDAPKDTGLRDYFMWIDGMNIVLLGNKVANVTREHVVRVSGGSHVLLHGNDFTNLDRRDFGDASDIAKGAMAIQKSEYVYAASNVLRGPAGFGPLGQNDGLPDASARTRFGVFEGNQVYGSSLNVQHGSERIMIRNNFLQNDSADSTTDILIEGYNSTYNRGVIDVKILNNTGYTNLAHGNFLRVLGPVDGITLVNNLYVAPNYHTGTYASAVVAVFQNDLSSFRTINSNVWEMPFLDGYGQGGINWMGLAGTGNESYMTPAEWNALNPVGNDYFIDTRFSSGFRPTATSFAAGSAQVIAGVFTDYYGAYRPASGWSAGAVEV
ncbi:MAG TPA: PKD domain-containing protein [Tepidisphaeraceae bacterium]|nr:PKD domain-containing protein [Tepidisphaeraceae bacterium]